VVTCSECGEAFLEGVEAGSRLSAPLRNPPRDEFAFDSARDNDSGQEDADGVENEPEQPKGWQGPWGTSYPANLRRVVATLSEDGFVGYMKVIRTNPPMAWYNVRQMDQDDLRSLYRYLVSLGDEGEQAPSLVPVGERAKTPFVVLDPPQMPPACTRDLDCGIGEVCSKDEPRKCVKK
jgi:hypothetical protein